MVGAVGKRGKGAFVGCVLEVGVVGKWGEGAKIAGGGLELVGYFGAEAWIEDAVLPFGKVGF